jgi:hypothetical protein
VPAPHRSLAQAAEALADRPSAVEAHRTLLLLDPLDRSEHHYRLARLLAEENKLPDARREAVMALEEAPRYRDAHRLLLEIVAKMDKAPPASAIAKPSPPSPAAAPAGVPDAAAPDAEPPDDVPPKSAPADAATPDAATSPGAAPPAPAPAAQPEEAQPR